MASVVFWGSHFIRLNCIVLGRMKGMIIKFTRVKEYWLNLMRSTQRKLSQGAANIAKVITSAHGEQWRKKGEKK
jgi:hypothetical protein